MHRIILGMDWAEALLMTTRRDFNRLPEEAKGEIHRADEVNV